MAHLHKGTDGQPMRHKVTTYYQFAARYLTLPLTDAEARLSKTCLEARAGCEWYHGGEAGRAAGDMLLPSSITGRDPRKLGDTYPMRTQAVYLTCDRAFAVTAAKACDGVVYRVQPVGDIEADPEWLRAQAIAVSDPQTRFTVNDMIRDMTSFRAPRARVLEVLT